MSLLLRFLVTFFVVSDRKNPRNSIKVVQSLYNAGKCLHFAFEGEKKLFLVTRTLFLFAVFLQRSPGTWSLGPFPIRRTFIFTTLFWQKLLLVVRTLFLFAVTYNYVLPLTELNILDAVSNNYQGCCIEYKYSYYFTSGSCQISCSCECLRYL